MFAVAAKGAVFNPLNVQLMADQIAYVVNHAESEVIVADPRLAEKLGAILQLCPNVRAVAFTGIAPLDDAASPLAGIAR